MKKSLLFIIIAGIIDLVLLIGLFLVLRNNYDEFPFLFLLVFPIVVSAIVSIIMNVRQKAAPLRILKWVLITYFLAFVIPAGLMILITVIFAPRVVALYGVQPQPEYGIAAPLAFVGFGSIKRFFRK